MDLISFNQSTGQPVFVNRTVEECATECVNANEKGVSLQYMQGYNAWNLLQEVLGEVDSLIIGFTGPEMRAELEVIICVVDPITDPLWVGCTLLLFAGLVIGGSLLAMDRAICCFKDIY